MIFGFDVLIEDIYRWDPTSAFVAELRPVLYNKVVMNEMSLQDILKYFCSTPGIPKDLSE
jgi:hypothetical protein